MSNSSPSFLKQRYLSERREFYLEKERIRVFYKDSNGDAEVFVRYEDLTTETRRVSTRNGFLYNMALSFGIFALVGFVAYALGYELLMRWAPLWAIAAVIFFGFYLWRRRSYLVPVSYTHLDVYKRQAATTMSPTGMAPPAATKPTAVTVSAIDPASIHQCIGRRARVNAPKRT